MKRGNFYRVSHPDHDPKRSRVFVIVSRQAVIDSRFSTVICAPVYSMHDGLASQVPIGPECGLNHESSVHCDELVSLSKTVLTDYIGTLSQGKINELNTALKNALELTE